MTNKEMFKDVDLPSLAVRMYNVMKNAKSVTKETARGGVPYKIVTHNEVKAGLSWSSRTPVVFCKLVINPAVLITA